MPTYQITNQSTLQSVVDRCCVALSLAKESSAVGASDPAKTLLVQMANLASLELSTAYEWPDLIREGSITVQTASPPDPNLATAVSFPLPLDFQRFVDQTQWNEAMRFPAMGPLSPQGWMGYLVFPISANFTLTWQVREGKIWFLNPPAPPGQVFRFMYMSSAIVRDAADPNLYKNVADKDGDVFLLDSLLITLLTRLKWLEAKGFDSSAAARDFATAWDSRAGAVAAPILNMAGGSGSVPLLGTRNFPDTNYAIPR
jgi:hypothetical protein